MSRITFRTRLYARTVARTTVQSLKVQAERCCCRLNCNNVKIEAQ